MMRSSPLGAAVLALGLIAAACSGASTSPISGDGGGAEATTDGGARADSGRPDAGRDAADASGDTGADVTDLDAGDAGPCPDEGGSYTIKLNGAGCGTLEAMAPQCVVQVACGIAFRSKPATGGQALNSDPAAPIPLAVDGSFLGAAITEGKLPGGQSRSGCTGAWDAKTSTLTVNCGGTTGSQACTAKLTRVAMKCG